MFSFPSAASAAGSAQIPKEKKEPAPLEAPGKLPCLGSGKAGGERQGEQALQALILPLAGRDFGAVTRVSPPVPQHQGGFHRNKATGRLPQLLPP